jgi:hypothetical protein
MLLAWIGPSTLCDPPSLQPLAHSFFAFINDYYQFGIVQLYWNRIMAATY